MAFYDRGWWAVYRKKWRGEKRACGLCVRCGVRPAVVDRLACSECYERTRIYCTSVKGRAAKRAWNQRNREKVLLQKRESGRRQNRRLKEAVLRAYGGVCACCGESTFEFLSVDHIDRGSFSKDAPRTGKGLYSWLRRNNFPSGLQILCHNCNQAKEYYGGCPHRGSMGRWNNLASLRMQGRGGRK